MTAIDTLPEPKATKLHSYDLRVERTDIEFEDVTGDRIRIRITVHNAGAHRSMPTPMLLQSAPLGAFVPWQPLALLQVPALEPGESRELTTEVARPRPNAVGDFNRIPPNRLLTALNSPDQPSRQPGNIAAAILNMVRGRRGAPTQARGLTPGGALAPDLWDLVGRSQPHWAGNLNVFIGRHAVERHVAKALRIYPGRVNLAMFIVGNHNQRDAYAFNLVGLNPEWKAELVDMANQNSLLPDPSNLPLETMEWVESTGAMMVILAAEPPANCPAGNLEVHVKRRSCGRTAIVEFSLDPAALGPGCYVA